MCRYYTLEIQKRLSKTSKNDIKFNNVARYRIYLQKSITAFSNVNSKHIGREVMDSSYIHDNAKKYLGVNLTKEVKGLYN